MYAAFGLSPFAIFPTTTTLFNVSIKGTSIG